MPQQPRPIDPEDLAVPTQAGVMPIDPADLAAPAVPEKPQSMKAAPKRPALMPGSTPQTRLQEQGVSFEERMAMKNFAPDNLETQAEWLRRAPGEGGKPQGFNWIPGASLTDFEWPSWAYTSRPKQYDAEVAGGQIAVRPKGTTDPWKVVDPNKADLQDVTDLGSDIAMGIVGGPVRGIGTLASYFGLGELARRGLGSTYGFKDSAGQVATDAGIQAMLGGAVGIAGKAAHGIGTAIEKNALRSAAAAGVEKTGLKELEARSTLSAAKLQAKREGEAEAERLAKASAERAASAESKVKVTRGAPEGGALEPGTPPQPKNVIEELEGISPHGPNKFEFDGSSLDPRNSHVAEVLNKVPRLRQMMQEAGGKEFAPDVGGLSMAARTSRSANMSPSKFADFKEKWLKLSAEFALDSKEAQQLAPHIRESLGRVLKGGKLSEDLRALNDTVDAIVKKTQLPDYLVAARRGLEEAIPPHLASRVVQARLGKPSLLGTVLGRIGGAMLGGAMGGGVGARVGYYAGTPALEAVGSQATRFRIPELLRRSGAGQAGKAATVEAGRSYGPFRTRKSMKEPAK